MSFTGFGALVFGLVVGFITYRTLIRTADKTAISDLTAVISAIGGGAVTKLYSAGSNGFAWYAIGLALGIAVFFGLYWRLNGTHAIAATMTGHTFDGSEPGTTSGPQA